MKHLMYQTPLPCPIQSSVLEREFYTVEEFVLLPEFGYLTKSGVRHLIFNSRDRYSASGDVIPGNGLVEAGAIVRLGRRVLISALKFRAWMLNQQEGASTP